MIKEVPKNLVWKGEKYSSSVWYSCVNGGYDLEKSDIKAAYLQGAYDALNQKEAPHITPEDVVVIVNLYMSALEDSGKNNTTLEEVARRFNSAKK